MAATKKTQKDVVKAAPSFYPWQLGGCRKLNASPDIIKAVLTESKTYTIDEANTRINEFLNRKV